MAGNRRAAANIKADPYFLGCNFISSPTGVSLNEKSLDDAAPRRRIPWTMRPLDDASLGRCVAWMMRPLDDASCGRCVPWTMRPLDHASLGRCVPWTMHLLDNVSLTVPEALGQTDLNLG